SSCKSTSDALPINPSNNPMMILLCFGYWLLAIGYWLLAIGYWLKVSAHLPRCNCMTVQLSD
ncbi:MAG: hypothetical protein ACRDAP_02355, partial [Shewanella sp.]